MELAAAALGSLLPKLATLLSNKYKLQKGVRGEIRFLQAEMESMNAALERVSKLPAHQIDDLNKIWVRDLKELVYDIEDSVDVFMVSVDAPVNSKLHSFRRFFDRTRRLLTKARNRHHLADDIQDIKRRIEEVTGRRERYNFVATAAQPDTNPIDPRVLASFERAAKLVGTDGPTEKISNLLTKGKGPQKQKLMVVSIVGVGGLGKTTIASMVYERLGDQFDCKAFVSVSLKPNMKKILSSILRQISEDKCTNIGEKDPEELIRSIRQFLMDKKYLIVIDDVWEEEAWKTIMCALIDMNHGSRVIVTTRNVDVANFTSVDGTLYELDPLSEEDSKRLLCTRIFNEEEVIQSELEEVTTKILKKCGGIPLAIITVSSMLACIPNKTKYEWYGVCNSMGSGLEKDKTLKNMRNILHLSYCDLPSYLKPCLLYLSMFPEDYVIPRNDLIRLWVAEGFVNARKGSNSYDLGEMYFSELINRSMIQPVDMNEIGTARACRVHDMVRDLIIYLSAQENFGTLSEGPDLKTSACKIRRLSLQGREMDTYKDDRKEGQIVMPATVDMSHVRSLIALGDAFQWMQPLSRFCILRVLVLELSPSKNNDPKNIFRLHHLRHLELRGRLKTELLEDIGNLQSLRTLDLFGTYLTELPPSIVQLKHLERLITDTGVKLPDGIGNLVSLQQLAVLDVENSPNTLAELVKLTELRVLTVAGFDENEGLTKAFLQTLCNLNNIVTLNFNGYGSCSLDCMPEQWRGPAHLRSFNGCASTFSELPRWFSSLCELSSLSICVNMLRQVDIQLLGALPVLRFLYLQVDPDGSTEEQLVIDSDQPFRSLEEFKFNHHSTSCLLVFGQGVMPRLQRLELHFEARKRVVGGFDVGLENLTSLKHVTVFVDCDGARTREVEDAETTVREAVNGLENHPTLVLRRKFEYCMKNDNSEERYKFQDIAAQPITVGVDPRLSGTYEEASKLVGTDGPAEKISNMLTQGNGTEEQNLKVVSIVGVGGLGKTTVANLVYERLGQQFDSQAFVPVSLKPDMKNILSSILRQVSKDRCTNAGEKDPDELIRSIRDFLIDKRFLIVIDDVWSTEAWEIIKRALIDKNIGSRVILTTRNIDVAKFASLDGGVYELDPLSEEDSRRLFCKRVFNEEDVIYSELEEITKKILKKCGGIPLAIITIASMLASVPNKTKYEWHGVYSSMGSGLENDKTLDNMRNILHLSNMRNILHLSYSDLPSYLKPCLLYLRVFAEDYKIRRKDLIWRWVAEGIVVGEQGRNSYDTGERYFNELANRSMIMLEDIDYYGVARACRLHDMILDLINSLSGQENFSTIHTDHLKSLSKLRFLHGIQLPTDDMAHARSIIVFGKGMPPLPRFSFLCVLALNGVASKVIQPKDLGSLHHLRYLELDGKLEPELLEGIGNLKLLKTLDLKGASIKELPTCIVQLQQLERLLVDSDSKFPDGVGKLTSLQELSLLNVEKSPNTLVELGKLTELRVLLIKGFDANKSYMETFLQSLSNLGNLRTLHFYDYTAQCSIHSVSDQWTGPVNLQAFNGDDIIFSELPRWFSSLSELSCLSIRVNVLRQVDIQLLGALPVLRFLNLRVHWDGTTEEQLVIGSDQPFRSLAEFKFRHSSRCWLVFGQGVMPRLQRLELRFEARKRVGGGFDVGLENLNSLKHVTVTVDCDGARTREVEDAEAKSRDAVDGHPNHPTFVLSRVLEEHMAEDENEDVHAAPEQQSVPTGGDQFGLVDCQ